MKLICPSCGAIASAETWMNDAVCRDVLAAIAALPTPLPKIALGYLGLFRPGERGLSWQKAQRIVGELAALVAAGYVSVQGKVDRDCSPAIWARAMEQMIEQRDRLTRPMKNHNYLRKIAWELANEADRGREAKARQSPARPPLRTYDPLEKARREYDEKVAAGKIDPNLQAALDRVGKFISEERD
ncbi:hypothetical protein [Desulfofustis limnaeus]|uniref:Uncharacterized protein n=1 Tax=Desulfofustis limnaeus TaxID=2740163 RepID=A0ABM7W4V5_9BACT|nr:hypothetical protein [Desulfofustis limnaeus]BDD85958.1 hypothetical protein DPPLL_03230 [Desulfofustis limnaeus]